MTQQQSRLALRILILASAFIGFVLLVLTLAGDGFLPKELADWKEAQESKDEAAAIFGLILVFPLIAAYIASLLGLFMYQKWAAWLTLGLSVVGSVFMLVEPSVESGVSAFFTDLSTTLGGVILGIAFFSDALEPDRHP